MGRLLSKAAAKAVTGIQAAVRHAGRMNQMGLLSDERFRDLKAAALEERLRIGDTDEYVRLRQTGQWDEIQGQLNHEEAGSKQQAHHALPFDDGPETALSAVGVP